MQLVTVHLGTELVTSRPIPFTTRRPKGQFTYSHPLQTPQIHSPDGLDFANPPLIALAVIVCCSQLFCGQLRSWPGSLRPEFVSPIFLFLPGRNSHTIDGPQIPCSTTCTMTEITQLMQYTFRGNHRNISPLCSHTMHRRWVLRCIVTAEGTFRKTKTKRPFKLSSTSDLICKTDVNPSEAFCTCKTALLQFWRLHHFPN